MKNRKAGCLGLFIIILLIYFVFQLLKWAVFNFLGVVGILTMAVGVSFIASRKKTNITLYWPIAGIVNGLLLTLLWFAFKEILNTLAFLTIFLFLYFIATAFVFGIRENPNWKKFSALSAGLFVLMMVLVLNAPDLDTNKFDIASTHIDGAKTAKKSDTVKQSANKSEKVVNGDSNTSTTEKTTAVVPPKNNVVKKNSTHSIVVPVTLTKTVDGDTIKVMYKGKEETVRYLLVDTPEEKKPGTCVQPYAVSAYNQNKQLVNSGKLTLEFETNGDIRDKYGRLLAYVFVKGKSVQEELLKDGYARVAYIYNPPYKYLSKYQNDEKIAKNKHLNIWSKNGFVTDRGFNGCASNSSKSSKSSTTDHHSSDTSENSNAFQNDPSDDRESNLSCKGKIKGNANSKIYHMPGDEYYDRTKDNIVWFCTESQAQAAGYKHSKR